MIFISIDNDNYIVKFSKRKFSNCISIHNYPKDVSSKYYQYQLIDNELIYNPRPIELPTENL